MSGFDPRAGIQPGEENDPSELPVFEQEIDLNAEQLSAPGGMVSGEEKYVLHADDLTAGYFTGVNILNGCSLTAKEGELVGIIGPNGAGKSTLLKAMFGLVRVHSGRVTLRGRDITNLRADALVKEGVGFVPQNNNVFPSLTIEENLAMGAYIRHDRAGVRHDIEHVFSLFRGSRSGTGRPPARCRAANSRCWRLAGR